MSIQLNLLCAWFGFVFCLIPGKFGKGGGYGFGWHFGDGESQVPMDGLSVCLAPMQMQS